MFSDFHQDSCLILGAGDAEIHAAGARLRQGHLVAFPTETVYGLGADALNNEAAKRIYAVKGRPPTDPLIVHVTNIEEGMAKLWNVSENILTIARCLFGAFSPGPLTLVAQANEGKVGEVVTGGSGCVGLRVPAHPVARALIDASRCPIAAPSANTFGHVSPTFAEHVFFDLASRDPQLTILDGGRCSVGVESTVARIVNDEEIEVLRRGAVSHEMMLEVLRKTGVPLLANVAVTVKDTRKKAVGNVATPMAGPGQLLTHYSPAVPAYLVDLNTSFVSVTNSSNSSSSNNDDCSHHHHHHHDHHQNNSILSLRYQPPSTSTSAASHDIGAVVGGTDGRSFPLSQTILIDYGDIVAKKLAETFPGFDVRKDVRAYKSLSPNCRSDEASREVFAMLRWTEEIEGAQAVALPLVMGMMNLDSPSQTSNSMMMTAAIEKTLLEAVEDRLFRAASGRTAQFVQHVLHSDSL